MARTLLDEELEVNPIYIEQQLAHAVKDANGTAYNRRATAYKFSRKQDLGAVSIIPCGFVLLLGQTEF